MRNVKERFVKRKPGSYIIPSPLNEFLALMKWIREKTDLQALFEKHLRVPRQARVYPDWPFVVFLIGVFSGMAVPRIKGFCSSITSARPWLAAALGMVSLPVQSAVSRYLCAVSLAVARTVVSLSLQDSCLCGPLISDPAAQILDNRGQGWHVFGFDFQVKAFRERDLPEDGGSPAPVRLGPDTARKGHQGRKRGEKIQSWAHCLHEGTALFVSSGVYPGNGDMHDALPSALEDIAAVCSRAKIPREQVLLRIDGAGGHFVFLALAVKQGFHYLSRYANYALLKDPGIQRQLNACRWRKVSSASGAGPQRWAAELAAADLAQVPELLGLDVSGTARLVVTRFAKTKDTSSNGHEHQGHVYELFLTSLPAEAFGSAETAEVYFWRGGEECRFSQSNRELSLNHLFSKNDGGQLLAMGVGKLVWNLRAQIGARIAGKPVPAVAPQPRADVWEGPLLLFPDAGTPPGSAGNAGQPQSAARAAFGGPTRRGRVSAVLRKMDLSEEAERRGVVWDAVTPALICWNGLKIPYVHLSRESGEGGISLIEFESPPGVCARCPFRVKCLGPAKTNARKRYGLRIPDAFRAELLAAYARRDGERPRPPSDNAAVLSACYPPAAEPAGGALEMAPSGLFPAALRHRFSSAARDLTVRVGIRFSGCAGTVTAAERKRRRNGRRRNWDERNKLNVIANNCAVSVMYFHDEHSLLKDAFKS